jgi:hypothetical protein
VNQSFWKNGAANSPTALEDINAFLKPHAGDAHHGPIHKTYKDHFQDAGFEVDVIKNQGAGAAMMRVEAARRVFPRCWFNKSTTQAGLEALGFYHEKKGEARRRGRVEGKMSNNPMHKAHAAPRCKARSKRTGQPCRSPAVRGWKVCRMHGARGGGA